jgi:hypothetical protein
MNYQHPPLWKPHFLNRDSLPKPFVEPCFSSAWFWKSGSSEYLARSPIRYTQDDLSP